ncbi:glycosyltransferase [candidate division KSB3 bacterium]|uniref:Glycosyltransferase n=1 Tax=candidate division KSB3 bacterium TaxID=2044937 RepID=A0A2G6E6N4_9BACT|nr:MAG: glycosyltransferase [candidate division KSB3 bacterium]PIE30174.1 MAG: glycosyltransferase [candidate division KSB3 bacterium]
MTAQRTHILLIASDSIDAQMAGPGIRYWEFARQLSRQHEVTLITPNRTSLSHPAFRLVHRTRSSLKNALQLADVIVTQGMMMPLAPILLCKKPLVVDLYDPLPIEVLEHHSHLPVHEAQLSQSHCIDRVKVLLECGDFFLYSHERQRDYWLGLLTSIGRINHRTYREDPSYSTLLACVPFGISNDAPQHTRSVLKGENLLFRPEDTVILWGGGLWKWFDPCSLIRAMQRITAERNDIKLLFLGARRAASDSSGIQIAYATDAAVAFSKELGLYQRSVFFHEDWIPYAERHNYFLESDIGLSTHFETLETHFSFRTRILDYLWAELPIITTQGDVLSERVRQHQLGITVAPGQIMELQQAILRLADDREFHAQCRENIRRFRRQFSWSQCLRPLENFCASPYRSCHKNRLIVLSALCRLQLKTVKHLVRYRGYKKLWKKIAQKLNEISHSHATGKP